MLLSFCVEPDRPQDGQPRVVFQTLFCSPRTPVNRSSASQMMANKKRPKLHLAAQVVSSAADSAGNLLYRSVFMFAFVFCSTHEPVLVMLL